MADDRIEQAYSDAVVIEDVRKKYGHVEALQGVSMKVKKGEIFGLLGANGAGKTTLIKILVGASRPNGGKVEVLGLDPRKQSSELRRRVGYMPQAAALYEDLSPRDNIRFFGAAHRLSNFERQIDEILEFTELRAREKDPVFGFSGGMKQRVSLACALVHKPEALFLDEPTAGVDPKLREAFWKHFRDLAASGVTLFISTHLMDEALLCDKLAIMRDGMVLVADTPKEIMRRGQTRIKVWRGEQLNIETVTDYPDQLPRLLQQYGMDTGVNKIEIEEDTLETIVLNLIDHHQALPEQKEAKNNVVHA